MGDIIILPQSSFDELCENNHWDDNNVESLHDTAFVSIIGTKDCLRFYLEEDETKHFFSDGHPNVINLDFDDISSETINYEGHTFYSINKEQAHELFEFIERNIEEGKTRFICHCRAGYSRSQAVGTFIYDFYRDKFNKKHETLFLEHCNRKVYRMLSAEYYKKYGTPFSEGKEKENEHIQTE